MNPMDKNQQHGNEPTDPTLKVPEIGPTQDPSRDGIQPTLPLPTVPIPDTDFPAVAPAADVAPTTPEDPDTGSRSTPHVAPAADDKASADASSQSTATTPADHLPSEPEDTRVRSWHPNYAGIVWSLILLMFGTWIGLSFFLPEIGITRWFLAVSVLALGIVLLIAGTVSLLVKRHSKSSQSD